MKEPRIQIEEYTEKISLLGEYFGDPQHPSRDWHAIIVVAAVLMTALILFAGYLFIKINAGEIFIVDTNTDEVVQPINRELLQEVLVDFREQATEFEIVREGASDIVDPSLR